MSIFLLILLRDIFKEFKLDAQIDGYGIKDVMLDIGFEVNILPKKSQESLRNPRLVYSPIKLWMAN